MNTNPEHYKWGLFYFNPKDSRVFLPKMNKMLGWTLNFANPISYVIIFCFIALLIYVGTL